MGVGLLLLALLLHHAGLEPVLARLAALGWAAPLILLPYLLIAYLDALGWRCTLPAAAAARVPLRALYLTRMAGEAVNSLTPSTAVGEPVKAYLLRAWHVSGSDGVASIVIARTALTVTQSLFVVLGLAALFVRLDRHAAGLAWLVVCLVGSAAFGWGLVWLQRRGPAVAVHRLLRRLAPRARIVARLEHAAAAIDTRLADYYRIERGAFLRASVWHMLGWLAGVTEVMLIMALIGAPVGWLDALVIEALAQPIRAVAIVIPGGLGAQELGGAALCTFLGVPEAAAVTLWLLKRGREIVFDVIGLLYLSRHAAWRRALRRG